MSLINNSKDTKSSIKELNKEWRDYTKKVDSLIGETIKTERNVTFVIRRKQGCNVSLSDIIEAEMKKLEHLLDSI
jgi:hypothetical protein